MPPTSSADQSSTNSPLFEWRVHPAKRKPLVTALVLAVLAGTPLLVFFTTSSAPFSVLAFVLLLASLSKFFLPTTYRLGETQLTVSTLTQTISKPWAQFRSFYPDKNGVLLSPFAGPSRLENFRGLYVMFENNSPEVLAHITRLVTGTPEHESGQPDTQGATRS